LAVGAIEAGILLIPIRKVNLGNVSEGRARA
jgi:hypothetical protein